MLPGKSTKSVLCALAFGALLALPVHAGDGAPSLWQAIADAVAQLLAGDDPEAGLSIEPGG